MTRSKKYKNTLKLIDKKKQYTLDEALDLIPKISTSKFDSSVDIHINLKLSDKQKGDSIKGSITLPHQTGSGAKVAVITTPDHKDKAKDADFVGGEDMIKKIEGGWSDFDVVIATPDIMQKAAVLGKILGPKGKMPNPKNETVTTNLKEVISSYKKGKIDFRSDKDGTIHQAAGKLSMKKEKLTENIVAFLKAVFEKTKQLQAVPFNSVFLAPTMGPSVRLDVNDLMKNF